MKKCAFLTLQERGDFVIDDDLAVQPLERLGWSVATLSWRQQDVPWSAFDLVVVRSTWDYWNDVAGFLEVLSRIGRETLLANPLDLVHWNLRKTYLLDLAGKGVTVVETLWLDEFREGFVADCAGCLKADQLVVKPVVGANGEDAFRIGPGEAPERLREIEDRFRGRPCMVQPFMQNILSEGEYSLFYFGGAFSHAILKVPARGEFRSQEERGAAIHPVVPEDCLRSAGRGAIEAVSPSPLYARIDLVRNANSDFEVMELELIEPSLYLRTDPAAPERFARAVDDWFRSR
jgi:glutathione synthase/RimK-type ligase-like ATP-grasp enzyme